MLSYLNPFLERARAALYARASLVCTLALLLPACATTGAAPPTAPCQAWVAAQASWRALDAYVTAQLEQQRVAACYVPPPPSPAPPAEPTPPAPTAPPDQAPLPGLLPREE